MILVDTSVLIDFQRTGTKKHIAQLRSLPTAVCGPIRAEILTGVRDPVKRVETLILHNAFAQVPIAEAEWDAIGDFRSLMASKGIAISLADASIGGVAILNRLELWSRDKAHITMAAHIPALRLYAEPP